MTTRVPAQYVSARRIGRATVTLIDDGALRWHPHLPVSEDERRRAMPEAAPDGTLTLGCHVAYIRLGAASVLVDTGYDDPSPQFGRAHPAFASSPGVTAGLASIGVLPEDITHVIITHAHGDHFAAATVERGGARVPRYPNARYLLGRRDWEGNPEGARPESPLAAQLGPIARLGLLELVDGEREVVPGIAVIGAPGESPGHAIVRVDSAGERFYFLGDLFHHPCEVAHPDWASPGRDRDALRASREWLLAEAAAVGATLAFTHGRFPPWGRVVPADGGYRWERA